MLCFAFLLTQEEELLTVGCRNIKANQKKMGDSATVIFFKDI